MRVRSIALGFTAAISVIGLLPSSGTAATTVKAGQRCTKAGEVKNGLVCTRRNNRLTYQRPAATTKAGTATTKAAASAPATTAVVRSSNRLVYMTGEVTSLDPVRFGEGATGSDRGLSIYGTLMRLDAKGNPQPEMAQSMTSPDQGKTWIIKLRPNIKFTDGTPYNADAVIFNIQRQINPASRFGFAGTVNDISGMRKVDDLTVELTLRSPDGSLPIAFTTLPGMMGSPTAIQRDANAFGSKPVGAGPYMVKEWVRDNYLDLVRNPDYFDKSKATIESIRVRMTPDQQVRAQALQSGDADVIYNQIDSAIALKNVKGIKYVGGIDTGGAAVLANVSRKPLDDVRIREAIALAFNPKDVNNALFGGLWTDEKIVCPPFNPNFDECETGLWPSYNPTRAKQLVDLYKAEGNSTDVTLNCGSGSADPEFIQQTLGKIGINVKLDCKATAQYVADLNAGNFQISWSAMTSFATPYPKVYTYFQSENRNLPKHKVPALDATLDRARRTYTAAERVESYRDFQRFNAKNFFYIWYGPFFAGFAMKDNVNLGNQELGTTLRLYEVSYTK